MSHDQSRSNQLLGEGVKLYYDGKNRQAAEKYRQALEHWDHPQIHYNLALALYSLEDWLGAHASLVKALKHGAQVLAPEQRQRARRDMRDLETNWLSTIVVTCDEPGAEVTVDGRSLHLESGRGRRRLVKGKHTIVAQKPGYLIRTRVVNALPGQELEIALSMETVEDTRRWNRWIPWTVVGTGIAVGLGGGWLVYRSSVNFQRYDKEFSERCMKGCDVPADLASIKRRAQWQNRHAVPSFAVSAALLATGFTMVVFNRPRTDSDERHPGALSVTPLLSPIAMGLTARIEF